MTSTVNSLDEPWVITDAALTAVLAQIEGIRAPASITLTKVQHSNHGLHRRDDVAVIPVVGPLFRYPNLLTVFQGTSTYAGITEAFIGARDDPTIKAIVLDIDSPGGEVNGCAALANTIYNARSAKSVIAYASGDCASGAYWLASACDKVIASATSCIGSIGVVAAYRAPNKQQVITLVSSQSPFKHLDPATEVGQTRLQARIDAIAQVFIDAVAKYRMVETTTVIQRFGEGDVYVGQQAVSQGLVDEVGSLEAITQAQRSAVTSNKIRLIKHKETNMDQATLQSEYPELLASIISQGVVQGRAQERERIAAIMAVAKGREPLAQHLAFVTELSVEIALATLQAVPMQTVDPPALPTHGFAQCMAAMDNPKITPEDEATIEVEQWAKRIAMANRGGVV